MFAKTLTVRTRDPLPETDRVFGALPAVDGHNRRAGGRNRQQHPDH
jgi:hypothetical protein